MVDVSIADYNRAYLATFSTQSIGELTDIRAGRNVLSCHIPQFPFLPGEYEIFFEVLDPKTGDYVAKQSYVGTVVVSDGPDWRAAEITYGSVSGRGPVNVPFEMSWLDPATMLDSR
jgi:hypothetical protein